MPTVAQKSGKSPKMNQPQKVAKGTAIYSNGATNDASARRYARVTQYPTAPAKVPRKINNGQSVISGQLHGLRRKTKLGLLEAFEYFPSPMNNQNKRLTAKKVI